MLDNFYQKLQEIDSNLESFSYTCRGLLTSFYSSLSIPRSLPLSYNFPNLENLELFDPASSIYSAIISPNLRTIDVACSENALLTILRKTPNVNTIRFSSHQNLNRIDANKLSTLIE